MPGSPIVIAMQWFVGLVGLLTLGSGVMITAPELRKRYTDWSMVVGGVFLLLCGAMMLVLAYYGPEGLT